jgi:thiol-disulfide isomerase/thioredoxin
VRAHSSRLGGGLAAVLLASVISAGPAAAATRVRPAAGDEAPPFRIVALDGRAFGFERFRGRPLYVNFFASWCPPCRDELPRIVAEQRRYRGRIAFLGVDTQEPEALARRFIAAERLHFPVGIDRGQMAVSYHAKAIPTSVFIGRDGRIRDVFDGEIPPARLARALARLLRDS